MAQKVMVLLTDDTTGEEADETVTFALDGRNYEIDLTEKNADSLRAALEPFRSHARAVRGQNRSTRGAGNNSSITPAERKQLKAWCEKVGKPIPADRGRLSKDLVQEWRDAGSPTS